MNEQSVDKQDNFIFEPITITRLSEGPYPSFSTDGQFVLILCCTEHSDHLQDKSNRVIF